MADPRYNTAEHKRLRARYRKAIEAGQGWCAETICLMLSRWIPPGSDWHLAHHDDGVNYKGPAHARCNTADGGRRRHQARVTRWIL